MLVRIEWRRAGHELQEQWIFHITHSVVRLLRIITRLWASLLLRTKKQI